VRSYFDKNIAEKRSLLIERMVENAVSIKFQKTDSVLEALILEASLIQKHLPPHNTDGKDQKTWNFVVITDENFPQVLTMRQRELENENFKLKIKNSFGPFTHGNELREALKIIRKIFPYRDGKCFPPLVQGGGGQRPEGVGKPCFNYQIGLCPGVCAGKISKKEYAKTIRNISLFFQGKKKVLIRKLEKEMKDLAKKKEFEKAAEIKRKISALQHIQDIAMIKSPRSLLGEKNIRIEAYDISHISGTNMVGVMVVIENGEVKKSDYRKFNIRGQQGSDDVRALREVVRRRFGHPEWPRPNLLVIDGGMGQVNGVRLEIENFKLKIPVVGVVKDEKHKAKEIIGNYNKLQQKNILLANSESHRFALAFHRKGRRIKY
jgi:excinuclease ABC subunit C